MRTMLLDAGGGIEVVTVECVFIPSILTSAVGVRSSTWLVLGVLKAGSEELLGMAG